MSVSFTCLPQNIKNLIDNTLVIQVAEKYRDLSQLLRIKKIVVVNTEEYNKLINLSDNNDNDNTNTSSEYTHLIPPYTLPCSHHTEGCLKKSAFVNNSNNKTYCWFHINYSIN